MLCRECCSGYRATIEDLPSDFPLAELAKQDGKLYRASGCPACRGTGYRGRAGLYELLTVSAEVRQLASTGVPATELRAAAIRAGLRSLRDNGWGRVLQGVTTVEEVLRVTHADEE